MSRDSADVGYNLVVTYQVSPASVSRAARREVVLRPCLLADVSGTSIMASTVNLPGSIAAQ